jgi:hypothetical protein
MRLQLSTAVAALVLLAATAAPARAGGLSRPDFTGELRFNYYYELSTLVYEPMAVLDATFSSPIGKTTVSADYTLDAVTSASLAFGVMSLDQLRYEFRNEVGGGISHDFGAVAVGFNTKFSKECTYRDLQGNPLKHCDYEAPSLGAFAELSLLDDTLVFRGIVGYGWDTATRFVGTEELKTYYAGLYATWIIDRTTILRLGYDLMDQEGFQSNFYRMVNIAGINREENEPRTRWRHTLDLALKHRFPDLGATAEVEYRWYHDYGNDPANDALEDDPKNDWGISAQDIAVRAYIDLASDGPFRWLELRLGYRLYAQNGAAFWKPSYGKITDRDLVFYTSDPKLSRFASHTMGARLEWDLSWLGGSPLAFLRWVDFRYDYVVVTRFNNYGNAHIFGASIAFAF